MRNIIVFEHFMSQMQHGHKLFNRKIAFLVRGKSCEIVQNICALWVKLNTCLLVCGLRAGHALLNRTKHVFCRTIANVGKTLRGTKSEPA